MADTIQTATGTVDEVNSALTSNGDAYKKVKIGGKIFNAFKTQYGFKQELSVLDTYLGKSVDYDYISSEKSGKTFKNLIDIRPASGNVQPQAAPGAAQGKRSGYGDAELRAKLLNTLLIRDTYYDGGKVSRAALESDFRWALSLLTGESPVMQAVQEMGGEIVLEAPPEKPVEKPKGTGISDYQNAALPAAKKLDFVAKWRTDNHLTQEDVLRLLKCKTVKDLIAYCNRGKNAETLINEMTAALKAELAQKGDTAPLFTEEIPF